MKEMIIEIIKNQCALEENVTSESLLKELSLDSLSFVSVIAELEDTFGVEFELEELNIEEWERAEDIIKAVEEKVNAEK